MNLIEQLGGYEKAKEILSRERNSENIDPVIYLNGNEILIDAICDALLEYRREHKMYEVGDWIIVDSYKPEYQFYQITKDDVGSHWINLVEFRHATDEEVKAGKRLEVKSDNGI